VGERAAECFFPNRIARSTCHNPYPWKGIGPDRFLTEMCRIEDRAGHAAPRKADQSPRAAVAGIAGWFPIPSRTRSRRKVFGGRRVGEQVGWTSRRRAARPRRTAYRSNSVASSASRRSCRTRAEPLAGLFFDRAPRLPVLGQGAVGTASLGGRRGYQNALYQPFDAICTYGFMGNTADRLHR
jgi:hypothetical protein